MRKYGYEEIQELIDKLSEIFDIARLVDPTKCRQVDVEPVEGALREKEICFARLHDAEPCANCASMQAFLSKKRETKYEMVDNRLFLVLAQPVTLVHDGKETDCVLEVVNIKKPEQFLKMLECCRPIDKFIDADKQVHVDSLTRAYNRRYYDDCIFLESPYLKNVDRISFIFADLHGFKQINDRYGHLTGDDVLSRCVSLMKKCVRPRDAVVRMGGDEFLIILPDCPHAAAERIVKDVQEAFAKELYVTPGSGEYVEIDMGVASTDAFDPSFDFIENLRAEADKEMYKNKKKRYEGLI